MPCARCEEINRAISGLTYNKRDLRCTGVFGRERLFDDRSPVSTRLLFRASVFSQSASCRDAGLTMFCRE